MLNTAISHKKVRLLLSALDLDPPSTAGMRSNSHNVQEKIIELNKADMREKLLEVSGPEKTVHVAVDTRYSNTRRCSSRRTGLSTATQMTTLAVELNSGANHIVAASTRGTACHRGAVAHRKDAKVNCPDHPGCTADSDRLVGFTERQGGHDIGTEIASSGVKIQQCTTDGDSRLYIGVAEAMAEADPTVRTVRRADITHRLQCQIKRAKKKVFSANMFPGVTTKKKREQLKAKLAADLKNRTMLILKHFTALYKADTVKIKGDMLKVIDTVLKCYGGNCADCARWSGNTCAGEGADNWFTKSYSLSEARITALNPPITDLQQLRTFCTLDLAD
nr:hypothetical protein BaRGS_003584 [Batillaria attramentaria]